MSLATGTKLGPYEIAGQIGAGGMGEVYKAKDTRLDRTVAIKVLPSHLADNPDLKQRFEREARAVSSLNHPHICTLHDIGSQEGIDFLVMEYLEGETLADRLKKGALPLDHSLRYAIEIADALDKAHRQGVVHRDLKPGNIMLTKSGAKLLDFGLAKLKATEPGQGASVLSALPTEEKPLTEKGSILGTFQYMSPEQLEGTEADTRTDLFAFGVVLYEMVTGRKAFEGKSQASLISAIMKDQPPAMSTLQSMSPPLLDHVVRRCLVKEPDGRWQSATDLMVELNWIAEAGSDAGVSAPVAAASKPTSRWLSIGTHVAAALLFGGIVAVAVWSLKPELGRSLVRFVASAGPPDVTSEPNVDGYDVDVAITPDGARIVYPVDLSTDQRQLVVRAMDQLEAIPLAGLGNNPRGPFISPDGNWIGYFDGVSALRKVSILGGPPVTICELPRGAPRGASWGADDTIVFATSAPSGLWRVPSGGGEPEELTTPDPDQGDHLWPEILPGGEAVLFTIIAGSVESAQIAVLSLATGEVKVLIPGGSNPRYAATGHMVYGVGGTLRAVGFDLERLEVTTDPTPVLEGIITKTTGAADFSISRDGSLVYTGGRPDVGITTLVWVDRMGVEELLGSEGLDYRHPRISPDGARVAVSMQDSEGGRDIYIYDLDRHTPTRLTFDPADEHSPLWTADGQSVVFGSSRGGGGIFRRRADGTGDVERLTTGLIAQPFSISRDGTVLVFGETDSDTRDDLYMLAMDEGSSPVVLMQTDFDEEHGVLSPDGRWLAYTTDEAGQEDIYVRPFPNVDDRKWRISTAGAREPRWGMDGGELFYRGVNGMMSVRVETEPAFRAGTPELLFEDLYMRGGGITYDLAPDGQRFLMVKPGSASAGEAPASPQVILVLNWFDELKRLVPTEN